MTSTKIHFLLIAFAFILSIAGCKPKNGTDNKPTQVFGDSLQIDRLIAQGKNLQNANIDSLPVVAKNLQQIGVSSGNPTALVYGKLYNAIYFWESGNHKGAMEIAVTCLADAEKWKVNRALPQIYSVIANLHKENTNYKMAFTTAEKGLAIATVNRDTADIIALLGLKAMFTHSVWLTGTKTTADKSLEFELEALKIAESDPKYERLRIRFYDNISQYYADIKAYDRAIEYGNKSVPLALKYNQQRSLTYVYSWLGKAYFGKGDRAKGLDYLNKALQISYKLKEPFRVMEVYESLYDCSILAGNFKQAIDYGNRSRQLHDSLQVQKNTKQIGELQIKYESVKKDKEIALLDESEKLKNKQILWILTGACLFIMFAVVLLLQSRVIHRNNEVIKASNAQLNQALSNIAYIQSHELRKPVASILGLVNVIKADDYIPDKETLHNLDKAAKDLDNKIQAINTHTQVD